MTNVSRRYQPAPAPVPPDEDYWAALLAQAETEGGEPENDIEIDWEELSSVYPVSAHDYGYASGNGSDWDQADKAFENDLTIHLKVIGFNRGGLLVEWNSLRGFVPASQLNETGGNGNHNNARQQYTLAAYVGQTLALRVIELSEEQNRLILSERAAQVQSGTRAAVLEKLEPGVTVSGLVTNICDFGAFVDLGGVEGLIHISELSWGRVEHPGEVLKRGDEVEVYVMSVDRDECRIALSIKRRQPDPWISVEKRYEVGQQVEGTITSVVDFGAFACLEEGLEGLIHISELAEGHFLHPRNVVESGQQVKVRILNIDSKSRRIGLSLRNIQV